jgi:hypothetical protein
MMITQTSLINSSFKKKFWLEVVAYIVFRKNGISHSTLAEYQSPIEVLKPDSNITNKRL